MTKPESKPSSWPEQAAILLIAMPVALFFGTWFQPIPGLPAAALTVWVTWKLASSSLRPLPMPSRKTLLFLALVAVLWTWTTGLGGMYKQMWDHNFRNALLHDLIDNSWPVIWETGRGTIALDYYLAWSMAPALVGKLLGWKAAILSMAAISAVGVFLVQLIFVRILGRWQWWIPMILVLWGGLDILGWGVRGEAPNPKFIETWSLPLWYLSHLMTYFCTPHLAIPGWLVTLLLAGRMVGPTGVLALSAFLVPLAPFQAIGIAPVLAWNLLQGEVGFLQRLRRAISLENILAPLAFVGMCAPYFLANQGAGIKSGWILTSLPWSTAKISLHFGVFVALEVLIPSVAIWMAGQRDRLFLLTVVALCAIPLRISGLSNDFALKVSVPGLLILTLYTARAFLSNPKGLAKWFLIGSFAVGAVTPLHELGVSTYYTFRSEKSLEADAVKTYDPDEIPAINNSDVLQNFRSKPLEEHPLLRWMLVGTSR